MSTPSRILYSSQTVTITNPSFKLPINSASVDLTVPIESVLVFGTLGASNRVQKEPTKVKMSVKSYLTSGITAADIGTLTGYALEGTKSKIVVSPNGFTGEGILTNLSLDASTNNFVTIDMSFEGVGTPTLGSAPSGNIYQGTTSPDVVVPITSDRVEVSGSCASTAKFSLDMPSDIIACLGSAITGTQAAVGSGNFMVAKPPFKTTITVEGTAAQACSEVTFGTIKVTLPAGKVVSQSINQAVGNIGQTYNFTTEDVSANFTDAT